MRRQMKRLSWICVATFSVITCGLLTPAVCRAEQCPWLNAATAGGFLGGEVKMSVAPLTLRGDTTCEFSLTQNSVTSTLRIAVYTMSQPSQEYSALVSKCDGTKTPLRTIGNEAIYCAANGSTGKEQIIGRVRDRAFVITVFAGSRTKGESGPSEEAINLAQQVAGALF